MGSYFPDGIAALDEVLDCNVPVKAFYDIDTPITIAGLRTEGRTAYLLKRHLPELDVYFSFTGGPMLQELESAIWCANGRRPLYCSVEPENYYRKRFNQKFRCDLSYLGTYAADRQATLENFLCLPARKIPIKTLLSPDRSIRKRSHGPPTSNASCI